MTSDKRFQWLTYVFRDLTVDERKELTEYSKFSAGKWGHAIRQVENLESMVDQLSQAAETLRDCWIERTGLTIEDDPYVEDACSVIESIRAERLSGKN